MSAPLPANEKARLEALDRLEILAPRVRIGAETRGRVARLSVEDSGIGMAPEHRERIFRLGRRVGLELPAAEAPP